MDPKNSLEDEYEKPYSGEPFLINDGKKNGWLWLANDFNLFFTGMFWLG